MILTHGTVQRNLSTFQSKVRFYLFALGLACAVLLAFFIDLQSVQAAQTVPYKVNFQGRLTNSAGNTVADGSYNIRFRLYSVSSAGTPIWTETREATDRITVQNGLFSVQLGDVSPLSASTFATYPLYLEVELPTSETATCSTASCASWTEGAMTPRSPLGSSPQAMNADMIDGLDSADLAQVGGSNTFTGTNIFRADSTNAFAIQNTNGDSLLSADTTNMVVSVGSSSNNIKLSVNGIQLAGNARSTRTVTLAPEYAGATFLGDGTNNTGSLSSDFCSNTASLSVNSTVCGTSGSVHSYYSWTTAETTAQDYDIYVRYRLPSDYDAGSMTNLEFTAQSTASGQPISLTMLNNAGTQCSSTGGTFTDSAAPEWATNTIANPLGTECAALTANSYVTFKVSASAVNGGSVRAGAISFTYRGVF